MVVGLARDAEAGRSGVEEAVAAGGQATFRQGDVRREDDLVAAIGLCKSEFGALDSLVNNAGILGEGRLHETTNEQWDDLVATHMTGTFWGCKHAVAEMLAGGRGGSIVNVGSILSFTGDGCLAAYTAMKSAILGLTKAIAIDHALDGIRCNCVCPGDMETPMIEQYFDGTDDAAAAREEMETAYPGRRIAHPREVATAVVFLVFDESSFVNGAPILVDGAVRARQLAARTPFPHAERGLPREPSLAHRPITCPRKVLVPCSSQAFRRPWAEKCPTRPAGRPSSTRRGPRPLLRP
jgi:NAD(P)-dependent dehydrogenase (short-subunit alcohol dehydrogenase family)